MLNGRSFFKLVRLQFIEPLKFHRCKKKITALLALIALVYGFPSCGSLFVDCEEEPRYFNITGLKIENCQISENGFGGKLNWKFVEAGETIPFEEFFMRGSFDLEYFSKNEPAFNFKLPNNAYASDCPVPGQGGSREKLDTLYLVTNNDFNEHFSAGDTINEIVESKGGNVRHYQDLQRFNPLIFYFFIENKEYIVEDVFSLRINQEPTFKDLSHSFKIIYKLENGEVYTAQTEKVRFE